MLKRFGTRDHHIEIEVMKDTGIDVDAAAGGFYIVDHKDDDYTLTKQCFDDAIADLTKLSEAIRQAKAYLREQRKGVK